MSIDSKSIEFRNNTEENRYELIIDDQVAYLAYMLHDDRLTFMHTDVPANLKGQGVASRIARFALEDAQKNGYRVKALCPFMGGYIQRHPEYKPLLRR